MRKELNVWLKKHAKKCGGMSTEEIFSGLWVSVEDASTRLMNANVESGVDGLKELLQKAQTPREIARLIEHEYDQDEMGRNYVSSTNFHNELKFFPEKDVKDIMERLKVVEEKNVEYAKLVAAQAKEYAEKLDGKVVVDKAMYDGQVHVDRKQLENKQVELTSIIEVNEKRIMNIFNGKENAPKLSPEIIRSYQEPIDRAKCHLKLLDELLEKECENCKGEGRVEITCEGETIICPVCQGSGKGCVEGPK